MYDDLEDLAIEKVRPYTKSPTERLRAMAQALHIVSVDGIPGDVVEVGVWRGGNVMLARLIAPSRRCWLFDTFDGMTEPDPDLDYKLGVIGSPKKAIHRYNLKKAGGTKWDARTIAETKQDFRDVGLDPEDRIVWVKGPVEDVLRRSPTPDQIAVLRLDVDWHKPTKASLECLYPKLVRWGFLIVDDYGHWAGARKAVDDYFGGADKLPSWYDADYTCRVLRKC
jgi:O-methyltransferase